MQHALDLDHDFGHLDAPTEQVDPAAAQPASFPMHSPP